MGVLSMNFHRKIRFANLFYYIMEKNEGRGSMQSVPTCRTRNFLPIMGSWPVIRRFRISNCWSIDFKPMYRFRAFVNMCKSKSQKSMSGTGYSCFIRISARLLSFMLTSWSRQPVRQAYRLKNIRSLRGRKRVVRRHRIRPTACFIEANSWHTKSWRETSLTK